MIRVIMSGCGGKMGKVISSLVADEKEMEIVAGIDVSDCVEDAYPVSYTHLDVYKRQLCMLRRRTVILRWTAKM